MPSVAVVYLDRWGNPPHVPKAFLDSLLRFPAGAEFDLIWQMKGYPDGASCGALAAFRQSFSGAIHEMRYPDDLYQFSLALDAARKHEYEFFLFFISWSRILARNWLKFYLDAFANHPDCGIVGATGSYEGLPPDQPFPNPHIRTNAFMVRRERLSVSRFWQSDVEGVGEPGRSGSERHHPADCPQRPRATCRRSIRADVRFAGLAG